MKSGGILGCRYMGFECVLRGGMRRVCIIFLCSVGGLLYLCGIREGAICSKLDDCLIADAIVFVGGFTYWCFLQA